MRYYILYVICQGGYMIKVDYCPNCNENTLHRVIEDDEIFEYAMQCLICDVVFQCNPPTKEPVQLKFDFEVDINAKHE
jgi:transcription elongation factor Elf1